MVLDLDNAVDRIRLACADFDDIPILPDNVYEYLLSKHSQNEAACIREAAMNILGVLSKNTRQRLDRLEVHGNESFEQYMKFINSVIRDPSGAFSGGAGIYAAGITKSDILANESNTSIIQRRIPVQNDVEIHSDEWNTGEYNTDIEDYF